MHSSTHTATGSHYNFNTVLALDTVVFQVQRFVTVFRISLQRFTYTLTYHIQYSCPRKQLKGHTLSICSLQSLIETETPLGQLHRPCLSSLWKQLNCSSRSFLKWERNTKMNLDLPSMSKQEKNLHIRKYGQEEIGSGGSLNYLEFNWNLTFRIETVQSTQFITYRRNSLVSLSDGTFVCACVYAGTVSTPAWLGVPMTSQLPL